MLNYLPGSASLLSDRAINRLQAQKLRGSLILFQRRDKDEIVQMRQPSKKSLVAAEEILDHVNYGLTRPDIIREWAEVIDENNLPLLEAANDLIDSADTNNGIADARYVQKLRAALAEYEPQPGREPRSKPETPLQRQSAERLAR